MLENITKMCISGYASKRIKDEIVSCEILCFQNGRAYIKSTSDRAVTWSYIVMTPQQSSESVIHRENGPAVEFKSGRKEWRQHGKLHRLDGPAVIREDGTKEWHCQGVLQKIEYPH